jgi:hypothetical protein
MLLWEEFPYNVFLRLVDLDEVIKTLTGGHYMSFAYNKTRMTDSLIEKARVDKYSDITDTFCWLFIVC